MKIKKLIQENIVIFIILIVLTLILHPKPMCSSSHADGWSCFQFPIWGLMNAFYMFFYLPNGLLILILDILIPIFIPISSLYLFQYTKNKSPEKFNKRGKKVLTIFLFWILILLSVGILYHLFGLTGLIPGSPTE